MVDSQKAKRWALVGIVVSVLVLGFDLTIMNVALPTMAADLGASTGELQWIVDSYAVVFAACMLPAGLLGDRFGRRKLLVTGLVIFMIGSCMGVFADSSAMVIAARTVMGAGGALIMPLSLAVIPSLFEGAERTKAIGAVTAGASIGMPLGPLLGGWLLDNFWWGSIFVLNIPLVAIGIAVCMLIPDTRDPSAPRVDVFSTALGVLGLGALVFGVIEAPSRGWGDALVVATLVGSVVLLVGLVLRERRAERPMLDLRLLGDRAFGWNTLVAVLATLVVTGLLFVTPQYLQAVMGNDPFGTGLRIAPLMIGLIVVGKQAPKLMERFGSRPLITLGMVLFAVAMLLGSRTDVSDGYGYTALWLTITGFGFGFAMVPAMDGAIGALPQDRAGSGTGLLSTLRQVGGAIGVAVLGSVLSTRFIDGIDTDGLPAAAADRAEESVVAAHGVADQLSLPQLTESANEAYVSGMNTVLLICGIAALLIAVLVAARLPEHKQLQKKKEDEMPDAAELAPADSSG
ncbi:MFS transporter [Streptomyces sp. NBC_00445]|uniref:MFS transporter n=1 Tax=Streptomyces sp. NBC_00445 TaxID=2975745 RepID=UPI002E201455